MSGAPAPFKGRMLVYAIDAASGLTRKEIAKKHGRHTLTIQTMLARARTLAGARNTAELSAMLATAGVVSVDWGQPKILRAPRGPRPK